MEEKKVVKVVAGIIYNENGEILCTQRDKGKQEIVSYKWEFPGGKIEQGETKQMALARELQEELEIKVDIKDVFYQVEHDYPEFHLSMTVFNCNLISHNIHINVHKAIKWLKPSGLLELDWTDADLPVAQKIYEQNCVKLSS